MFSVCGGSGRASPLPFKLHIPYLFIQMGGVSLYHASSGYSITPKNLKA